MKKVYLIRHGMPDFPEGKKMCIGITDIPLGPQGGSEAKEMAEKLPPVTHVFSSPLRRAVQTAEAIGMNVRILPDLREMDAGEWDGLTFDEIRSRYPALYAARGLDPTLPLPGAEDHAAGIARFTRAMDMAAAEAAGDFAVVAHGGIIAQFLLSLGRAWYKPGYAEIIPVCWQDGRFFIPEEA